MRGMVCCVIIALVLISCKGGGSDMTAPPPPGGGGLTATPSSVHLLPGQNAAISISGGTRPEGIVSAPDGAVATASISDTVVTVHAVSVGSTSFKVGDHSTPQKTASIVITIATAAAAMILQ